MVTALIPKRALYYGLFVFCLVLTSIPFAQVGIVPSIDYLNHLARMHILLNFEYSKDLYQFYNIYWRPMPNIGSDLLIVQFAQIFSLNAAEATRLVTILICVSFLFSVAFLHHALHRRLSLWPLIAAIFVFNYILVYGFLNYLLGISFALFAFGLWIRLRARVSSIWLVLLFSALTVSIFFIHLYSVCYYAVLVMGFEGWVFLTSLWRTRQFRTAISPLLVAALPFVLVPIIFFAISPTADNVGRTKWSSLGHKIDAIYSVLSVGSHAATLPIFIIIAAVVVYGLVRRRFEFAPGAVFAACVLGGLFLAMPFTLLGSGFADFRLPIAVVMLLIAATDWRTTSYREAAALVALFVTIGTLRVAWIANDWAASQGRYDQVISAFEEVPMGSTMLGLLEQNEDYAFMRRPPMVFAPLLATVYRDAFVPGLFNDRGTQLVSIREPYASWWDSYNTRVDLPALLGPEGRADFMRTVSNFEYLFVITPEPDAVETLKGLETLVKGADFVLLRVGRIAGRD